ncbi:MAG: Fur family transcriptional regulator [Pseudomonadota bacterium]
MSLRWHAAERYKVTPSKTGDEMGEQKTANQSMVLAVLLQHRKALTAYEVLDELREENPKMAPTTIYRALSGLEQLGCVHRIESMNAYIACRCEHHSHASVLSVCDDCGLVEERVAPDLLDQISDLAGRSGFTPVRHVVEVHGMCARCENGAILS